MDQESSLGTIHMSQSHVHNVHHAHVMRAQTRNRGAYLREHWWNLSATSAILLRDLPIRSLHLDDERPHPHIFVEELVDR